jgi:prevent-host-death family protein
MNKTISATEARVHFGQWLRRVSEQNLTVIVEKAGKPEAVLLSMDAYGRLQGALSAGARPDPLAAARALRERIHARRGGQPMSSPEDVIARMREDRQDELTPLR